MTVNAAEHTWHMPFIELPSEPFNEVHPGVYVGGHDYWPVKKMSAPSQEYLPDDSWTLVVSMYHVTHLYPPPSTPHIVVPFLDSVSGFDDRTINRARMAASAAFDHYMAEDNAKILFRCQAGINRSSFVAALFLRLLGISSDEAIRKIRAERSLHALSNPVFADYLRSLD